YFSTFVSEHRAHRDLHSFPTRRSSDLASLISPRSRRWSARRSSCPSRPSPIFGYAPITVVFKVMPAPSHPAWGGARPIPRRVPRSEEHTSELQSRGHLVCRLLLEKKKH